MNKLTKYVTSLVFVCILSSELQAQFPSTCAARLQSILDSVPLPPNRGVSAAVYIPGAGTWLGVRGYSHDTVRIKPGMKFPISSMTKLYTSVILLKLQELNILSLDDSLHEWLPTFPYVNPNITIRQLLNHTSGVFDFVSRFTYAPAMNSDTGRFWTPQEMVTTFAWPPYCNPPPCAFNYSNTNYTLAGMIIREATDTTVSHNFRQFIKNPLNLTNTYFPLEEAVPDTIAHGWANGNEYAYPWTSWTSGRWCAANIYATAENCIRFYKGLFDMQVINQTSMNQMLTWVPAGQGTDYGLGIYRRVLNQLGNSRVKYQHEGYFQKGFRSGVRIDSASRYIVAVIVNDTAINQFTFINALDNEILRLGNCWPVGVTQNNEVIPKTFQLHQNYPNPFNPATKIKFDIPSNLTLSGAKGLTKLSIYDVLGREVAVLVNEALQPGSYEVDWDGSEYPSGVYFYKLTAGDFTETKKMVLMK